MTATDLVPLSAAVTAETSETVVQTFRLRNPWDVHVRIAAFIAFGAVIGAMVAAVFEAKRIDWAIGAMVASLVPLWFTSWRRRRWERPVPQSAEFVPNNPA